MRMNALGGWIYNMSVIGGFVWLATQGHPWMAALLLIALASNFDNSETP